MCITVFSLLNPIRRTSSCFLSVEFILFFFSFIFGWYYLIEVHFISTKIEHSAATIHRILICRQMKTLHIHFSGVFFCFSQFVLFSTSLPDMIPIEKNFSIFFKTKFLFGTWCIKNHTSKVNSLWHFSCSIWSTLGKITWTNLSFEFSVHKSSRVCFCFCE